MSRSDSDLAEGLSGRQHGYAQGLMEMQPIRQVGGDADEHEHVEEDISERGIAAAGPVLPGLPRGLAIRLYVSHFLSTWNSRLFEFGAVLFLASIFPGTLLPMSVYALARSASAILFAQSLGAWIDRGDRLTVVRVSIIGQRLAVASSCVILGMMELRVGLANTRVTDGQFVLVVLLACVEKLCSVTNLVSVERDWVVVITEGNEALRRALNARMRRIDLLCKLLGPLVISNIAIASTLVAIWATLGMNVIAVFVEYMCIAQVYERIPALKRIPTAIFHEANTANAERHNTQSVQAWLRSMRTTLLPIDSLPFYLHHPAFLPSFSLSLLYLTVLSFSGQMVTYLLSVGYTPVHVGVARTVSTVFELSATWIAPRLMARIGPVRGGIWSLSWQMVMLAAAITWLFSSSSGLHGGGGTNSVVAATGLAVGVALSRIGLWGYDLCAQTIVQDEIEADHRGAFSTVEAAFQNLFELFSYATTIIFSRPDQFQWPVAVSGVAVYVAGGMYAYFVRRRRGHLLHAPPCICEKS